MPFKNGYQPLGQDEPDLPEHSTTSDTTITIHSSGGSTGRQEHKDTQRAESYRRHVAVTVTEQDDDQSAHQHSTTQGRNQRITISTHPSTFSSGSSNIRYEARRRASSTSAATVSTTAAAGAVSSPRSSRLIDQDISLSPTSTAPTAGTDSSGAAGTLHQTLLDLKDHYSSSNSNTNSSSGGHHPNDSIRMSKSPPSRSLGASSGAAVAAATSPGSGGSGRTTTDQQTRRSRRASASADLGFLRPKQHSHTTESGPRGIEKAQKRQVLRDIRPDPHNLPEELLREQARSEAAVDALSTGAIYHHHHHHPQEAGGLLSPLLPGHHSGLPCVNTGTPGSGGSPGTGMGGTTTGTGEGGSGSAVCPDSPGLVATPVVASGERSSKWRRRLRRLTNPRFGRENRQRVFHSSVFTPVMDSVIDGQNVKPAPVLTPDHDEPMTSERFVAIVDSVKDAIKANMQPERIVQGSSGSYFCRTRDGRKVGVFKPKNEEPYGQLNPKWTKWIHRNLFPCCFGRSCLIPNLGYISEAATSLVDRRLKLNIVPTTEIVWLSSPAFHYDYLDRRAAKLQKGAKPLPDKVGSFQLFLHGFNDANLFLKDHPWPVEPTTAMTAGAAGAAGGPPESNGKGKQPWRWSSAENVYGSVPQQDTDGSSLRGSIVERGGFSWTPALQQQFREQFEKMIILDYLIRNTDRGLDNWMIRYCERDGITIAAGKPIQGQKGNLHSGAQRASRIGDLVGKLSGSSDSSSSSMLEGAGSNSSGRGSLEGHNATASSTTVDASGGGGADNAAESYYGSNHVHVAAIDNGLAFPFKHPDSWRSYPYGWLFLPDPLISQPFTKATRDHFLPLLSSPVWWRETIADLRRLFSIDDDFDQGMFEKQMAVMKGQGWNIVEALKNPEHGPKDLCRRVAVIVWDEEVKLGPGVSPEMARQYLASLRQQQQEEEQQRHAHAAAATYSSYSNGGGPAMAQPKAITMDVSGMSYGSIGDRLPSGKTLSSSITAVNESTPFLQHSSLNSKKGSLPHLVINVKDTTTAGDGEEDVDDGDEDDGEGGGYKPTTVQRSFRQVVSDGEYDDDDFSDDDDDDGFSHDDDYDIFDDDMDGPGGKKHSRTDSTTQLLAPPAPGMTSIDRALSSHGDAAATTTTTSKGHHRRRSSQDVTGGRRRQRSSSDAVVAGMRTSTLDGPSLSNNIKHSPETNGRVGAVRFDTSTDKYRMRRVSGGSAIAEYQGSSAPDTRIRIPSDRSDSPDDPPVPERGRSLLARGYGSITSFRGGRGGRGGGDNSSSEERERLSERPKWADRLRRGLSFDGHLLGQSGSRGGERKRKQRRERERVVIIEQVELVTKNLPYFKWW
ncbi:phosphatidylinositol 3 and 4-kinase-domain-containing protein [Mortierella sp. GBAus27b]|nr:phosphatidylinositol 3 and 4-kinase-domain-containing protein [Mortierella sp. GBAus27b]